MFVDTCNILLHLIGINELIIGAFNEAIYPMFAVKLRYARFQRANLWATTPKASYGLSRANMLNEFDVIRDVTRRFEDAGIPHMLTGSLAMNYYSLPRMTRDIDFVVEARAEDVDKILSAFESDYYVEGIAISRAISHQRSFNMIHNEAFIKVDCIIRKASEYRQLEFSRRQQAKIQDVQVWLVSKEDLIISKLVWARDSHSELQLRDVKNLVASGYDVEYLDRWIRKLELNSLLQECLE
jgi:hypothetical protein